MRRLLRKSFFYFLFIIFADIFHIQRAHNECMDFIRRYIRLFVLVVLVAANLASSFILWEARDTGHLKVAFLNIGQGDAIYIESPDHHNMLIDSGPDDTVIKELQKVMRWNDRHIDVLMVSNPDKDHIDGFLSVLQRYSVGEMIEPGTTNISDVYHALEQSLADHRVLKTIARRGQEISLGHDVHMNILFPDRNVSSLISNPGSIIAQLIFGSTSVMFTGDATLQTEEYVIDLYGSSTKSTLLKEGHHGSRTAASYKFFSAVQPDYSIISCGYKNRYGHPHKETMDLLSELHIPALITYKEGTIVFDSDGKRFIRDRPF